MIIELLWEGYVSQLKLNDVGAVNQELGLCGQGELFNISQLAYKVPVSGS